MASGVMGGLQQQRAELDAALAEVRREMKSARQKKKDMGSTTEEKAKERLKESNRKRIYRAKKNYCIKQLLLSSFVMISLIL